MPDVLDNPIRMAGNAAARPECGTRTELRDIAAEIDWVPRAVLATP